MKRILDERPLSPADYGQDQQEDTQGKGGVRDTAPGQIPARQADGGEQAGQTLPPMAFPGPLAFQPPPVMLPAPDVPNVLPSSIAPAIQPALVDPLEREDRVQVQIPVSAPGTEMAKVTSVPEAPPLLDAARLGRLELIETLPDAGAQVNLDNILGIAIEKNYAGIIEVLFRHGAQRSDLPADLSNRSASFVAAIEDLAAGLNASLPALPGPESSAAFFQELIDKPGSREPADEPMLQWLQGKGLRRAYAVQLLAVLSGAQPWKIHDAGRQQKML